MGYRFNDNPPKPEDMLLKFPIRNGAIGRIAFGCYYLGLGHSQKLHDHFGWPNPDNPDHICQDVSRFKIRGLSGEAIELDKIHLTEEGYDQVYVAYEDTDLASHLTTEAWIDEEDDYIVRMRVGAHFDTFSDKPVDIRFTVFVAKSDGTARDAVCHGMLTILPGGIGQ